MLDILKNTISLPKVFPRNCKRKGRHCEKQVRNSELHTLPGVRIQLLTSIKYTILQWIMYT